MQDVQQMLAKPNVNREQKKFLNQAQRFYKT
jgi:hypothetical protein